MNDRMFPPSKTAPRNESFDDVVLPHLGAAYHLARCLMRNEHDAEDVVQEASLRALRYFQSFTGGNGRAWFLRIVRNTCWGWHGQHVRAVTELFDEERHSTARRADDPETLSLQTDTRSAIERAIGGLPDRARDLFVLRELEGLSYRELADAMGIPMGTVMSSLSRSRRAVRGALSKQLKPSGSQTATHPREQEADAVLV